MRKKLWFLIRLEEGVGYPTHKGWRWDDEPPSAPLQDVQPMTQSDYLALELINVRNFDGSKRIKNDAE